MTKLAEITAATRETKGVSLPVNESTRDRVVRYCEAKNLNKRDFVSKCLEAILRETEDDE